MMMSTVIWPKNGLIAMSPLRHRSLWGRKVRKRLGKAKSEIRPPRPKLDWGLVWAWCGPGAGLRAWCGPGAGLVRAWCGPGFRHVVDAYEEGQAAREERVSEL